MSIETIVKDIAAIAAAKKIVADAESGKKAELAELLTRGTVYAYDAAGNQLGYAMVPKASEPKPVVELDEDAVLPWVLETFGDEAVTLRLTAKGRAAVVDAALADHEEAGAPAVFEASAGVRVSVPARRVPAPRFVPVKDVVELVRGMARRGEIALADVLELSPVVPDATSTAPAAAAEAAQTPAAGDVLDAARQARIAKLRKSA